MSDCQWIKISHCALRVELFTKTNRKYECNSRQLCPWAICKANIFYFLINYARIRQNEIILDEIAFLIWTRYCSKASGNVHKWIKKTFETGFNLLFNSWSSWCDFVKDHLRFFYLHPNTLSKPLCSVSEIAPFSTTQKTSLITHVFYKKCNHSLSDHHSCPLMSIIFCLYVSINFCSEKAAWFPPLCLTLLGSPIKA